MKFYVYPHEPLNKIYPYGIDDGAIGFFTDAPVLHTVKSEPDADYFIVPFAISINHMDRCHTDYMRWCSDLIENHCSGLDSFQSHPDRHIFFHVGDYDGIPQSCAKSLWYNASTGNHGISLFQPIRLLSGDSSDIKDTPYDVSFQGTLVTHPVRQHIPTVMEQCRQQGLKCFYQETSDFYRKIPDRWKLRNPYIKSIRNTKFVLCPRGWGHNSIRFFETLALGRIPVLISADARLPLEHLIDYKNFVVKIRESEISNVADHLRQFMESHNLGDSSVLAQNAHHTYFANTQRFMEFTFLREPSLCQNP